MKRKVNLFSIGSLCLAKRILAHACSELRQQPFGSSRDSPLTFQLFDGFHKSQNTMCWWSKTKLAIGF